MAHERILVVDDQLSNRKLLSYLLTAGGYEVRVAAEGEEALKAVALFRPHLILMDVQLPGMDGLTLTRRLKTDPETRDILVVAVTAFAMKGDDAKALEAGCDGYITKPIDTRTFPETVAAYLARASGGPPTSGA